MSYTYFTDRDLGKAFPRTLRRAGLLVQPHDSHFGPTTLDEEWLTKVGVRDWLVITHDQRIRYKPNERDAVMNAGVGMLVLVGAIPHPALAKNFLATLPAIERFIEKHPRPFIAKVYRPSSIPVEELGFQSGRVEMWLSSQEWGNRPS